MDCIVRPMAISHGPIKFLLVVFLLLLKGTNKCSVHLCNKKLLPLPTGTNWPHLLQQMSLVYFYFYFDTDCLTKYWDR